MALDHDLLAVGITLERPTSTASERSPGRKRVLHELEVSAEALFDLCEYREWRCHDFRQNGPFVSKAAEHRSIRLRTKQRLWFEGLNFPVPAHVHEGLDDTLRAD